MKEGFARQYGDLERWHWWFRGRRRILAGVLRRRLPERRPLRMVSVGCGPAEGLEWLEGFCGPSGLVVGLDQEIGHAAPARDRRAYVVGRLEAVPLIPESFDALLALDVFEHLDNDAAGLGQAAAVVRPGGLLVVTVPAMPSLWGRQDVVSHHRRRYTRRALRQAFSNAGLPEPEISFFNALLFPPIALLRWWRRLSRQTVSEESDFAGSRPGAMNRFLEAVFSLERHLVGRVPLPFGISLLATVKK